jgi:uncharacterized membrane protein YphA (DoxX/SURF4 family)
MIVAQADTKSLKGALKGTGAINIRPNRDCPRLSMLIRQHSSELAMTDTGTFLASVAAITMSALALLSSRHESAWARGLVGGFATLCVVDAVVGLFGVVAVTFHLPPLVTFYRAVLGGTAVIGQFVVGVAVAVALAAWWFHDRRMAAAFAASRWLMIGLIWYVALAFAGFEIGKAAHDAEMRQFFLGSGYPVVFMYVVMAVEIVGALGLLVARLRIAAAVLLILVMLGAIATHARNGDPFSDSLDAVRMLLLVASIAVLGVYQCGRRTVVT